MTPLETRARDAWKLAHDARHETNWGRAVRSQLDILWFLRDPHPLVRRLAEAFRGRDGGICA